MIQRVGTMARWRTTRWDRTWIWGVRRGEWWVGVRRNLAADALELNMFGLTLMVGVRGSG